MLDILLSRFELKSFDESTGYFEGLGAHYDNVDLGNDICVPGCFDETIASHKSAGSMPSMFWNHNPNEPVGDWSEMAPNAKGLMMGGRLWLGKGIPRVEQTYMFLKSRSQKGLSIGYQTKQKSIDKSTGARRLEKIALGEVSVVPFPMNPKAVVTNVKSLLEGEGPLTPRDAERILRDAGFSGREAKQFISRVYDGIEDRDGLQSVLDSLRSLNTTIAG